MKPEQIEERLTSYLLGALAPEQMDEVRRAVELDAELQRQCDEISQTLEFLSGALISDETYELSSTEKAAIKNTHTKKPVMRLPKNRLPVMHLAASFIMLLAGVFMLMAVKSSKRHLPGSSNGVRIVFADQSETPELSTLPELALDQELPDLSIPHPVENITTIQSLADLKINEVPLIADVEKMKLQGLAASNEWAVSSIRVPSAYLASIAAKDVLSEFREIRDGTLTRYRVDYDHDANKVYVLAPENAINKILAEIRNESMKYQTMASPVK